MRPIQEIKALLNEPKKIVITMHQKPDADAMGSSLALFHYLNLKGHRVSVISPTNYPEFLKWMPGCVSVIDFENRPQKAISLLKEAELLFCLDFNDPERTRDLAPYLSKTACPRVLIDHHPEPIAGFEYGLSDTSASSTTQLIYEMIFMFGDEALINDDIAQCIYAGTMTDTGSFRFSSTTARVHRMVADLFDRGLQHEPIHQAVYDNFLENRLRFLGEALSSRLEFLYPYNTALIAIPNSDLKKFQLRVGDTEGLVNFPLSIKGIRLAALLIERDHEIKLSFRSKGDFDVNSFARQNFEGGGHQNASGGRSSDTLERTVTRFKNALEANKDKLSHPI